jgi:hypothetical protein
MLVYGNYVIEIECNSIAFILVCLILISSLRKKQERYHPRGLESSLHNGLILSTY